MAPVTTAVLSDLHLGDGRKRDLLRRDDVRGWLLEALQGIDRLVLCGDVIELRQSPAREVLAEAGPVLGAIGDALPGVPIVLVPGNHDHPLIAPWLDRRRLEGGGHLSLEQVADAHDCGPLAAALADHARTRVSVAYPGLWIRPDVYAAHGHYLDCHMTMPRIECLIAAASERLVGGLPPKGAARTPDDYEAALAPLYSLSFSMAQGTRRPLGRRGPDPTLRFWQMLHGEGPVGAARSFALGTVAVPTALAALNRLLPREFSADLSGEELLRSGLEAMREVLSLLGIEPAHAIFGHTHRPGPLAGDPRELWRLPGGGEMLNTGSWIYEPTFFPESAEESPYLPGTVALVPDEGPPELRRVLRSTGPGGRLEPA